MKHISIILLFALGMPQLILSLGCPDPLKLGPRTDNDKSMCAILYGDENRDENLSCGGGEVQVENGVEASSMPPGWNDQVSSLVVRRGCTLTGYQHGDFLGKKKNFQGVHFCLDDEHSKEKRKWNWNDEMSSYMCKCAFEPVDCTPIDKWELMQSCNNKSNVTGMTCTYLESHGITVGTGFTNGLDYSATLSEEIGMEFAKASASLTTGYSWSTSKEFSTTMTESHGVEFTAPPGAHIAVYQIQGECGDSITKTTCFEQRDVHTKMILSTTCPEL